MARSRSGFRGAIQSHRRQTAWSLGPNSLGQFITTSSVTPWSNGVQLLTEAEATIVRVRGYVSLTLEAISSLGDGFSGAFGMGIVSANAQGVGGTAIPAPVDDADWPGWLWHRFFDIRSVSATLSDGANAVAAVQRIEIDSKAMRKLGNEEVLQMTIQVVEQGTATIEMHGDSRILFKLS